MTQEFIRDYLETLDFGKQNFLYGFINLEQPGLKIDWDLDQTLSLSEEPVKLMASKDFNGNYSARRVDGWDSISKWLLADKKFEKKEDAKEYERRLWTNGQLLYQAPPNEALRALSYVAWQRGIPQSITTVRVSGLRQVTYKWIDKYFWWIRPGEVNFNISSAIKGHEYKVNSILEQYAENPGLIHVDDDLTIIQPLAEKAPKLGLIGIKYPSDDVDGLNGMPNRVFVERDVLSSMIPYNPRIVR